MQGNGRIRHWLMVVLLAGLTGVGVYLGLGGLDGDDREVAFARRRVDRYEYTLEGLARNLRRYRETHGRYPTNDEGLAALDTWEATASLKFVLPPENEPFGYYGGIVDILGGWNRVWAEQHLAELKQEHGTWEAALKPLCELLEMRDKLLVMYQNDAEVGEVEDGSALREVTIAVDSEGQLYVLGPAGPITPKLLPYVYENRNGLAAAKFADSHAADSKPYAVKVDEGVYVWAVGGIDAWQNDREEWWEYNTPRVVGGAMVCGVVIFLLVVWLRKSDWRGRYIIAAILGTVGIGVSALNRGTCYITPAGVRRNPEITAQRRALLDTYHKNGVIGEEAYKRAVEAIEDIGRPPQAERTETQAPEGSSTE